MPLLAALEPPVTVALLAHELAHERNGDARRGRLVGSSLTSLSSTLDLLRPQPMCRVPGRWRFSMFLTNVLLWLCSQPPRLLLTLQAHLLYRDSQRAEYLADELAASVAGTDAVIGLHDTLLAKPAVEVTICRVTIANQRTISPSLLDDIRAAACEPDTSKRDERRRRARAERRRLDSTHPPIASRIAVLERRPTKPPVVVLDAAAEAALADELRRVMESHTRTLIDHDRGRMYYG
ncbi:MAG: M48 family metalloprotease [Solirubrobacteraceae bacterium]